MLTHPLKILCSINVDTFCENTQLNNDFSMKIVIVTLNGYSSNVTDLVDFIAHMSLNNERINIYSKVDYMNMKSIS